MTNLSKYELLQHRHLSLLRALDEAGVEVTCGQDGKWQVKEAAYDGRHAVRLMHSLIKQYESAMLDPTSAKG